MRTYGLFQLQDNFVCTFVPSELENINAVLKICCNLQPVKTMPKSKKVLEERKKFLSIKAASRATKAMLFEKEKNLS